MTDEMEFKAQVPDLRLMQAMVLSALLTLVVIWVFPHSLETMRTREFWMRVIRDPHAYIPIAAGIWLVIGMRLRAKYERLYVGPAALRYVSPYAGPFRLLGFPQPGWSIDFAGLEKAELQVQSLGLGKRRYLLVLQGASGRRVLEAPLFWQRVPFIPGSDVAPPRRDEAEMRRAIMNSPLVRALRNRGVSVVEIPGLVRPEGALKGYDIAQDKGLMTASMALVALLLYFLGDTFIVWPYMALQNVPLWPYAIAAPVGLWIGLELGKKAPRMERILISVMLAGAFCGACYPAMLRLDALTAGTDDHVYSYVQAGQGYFKPPQAGLPYIYFANEPAYWSTFRNGSTHDFRVVKGALGFYEVDTGRVQEEVRTWWASRKVP